MTDRTETAKAILSHGYSHNHHNTAQPFSVDQKEYNYEETQKYFRNKIPTVTFQGLRTLTLLLIAFFNWRAQSVGLSFSVFYDRRQVSLSCSGVLFLSSLPLAPTQEGAMMYVI